ncbi:MAG: transposase [Acidobacteriaceae bacterium]
MEKLPRQVYTPEYRAQAVRLVTEQKKTVPRAARELGMSEKTLGNWVYASRHGGVASAQESRTPPTELEAEVSRLRRALVEAQMERDILKKCMVHPLLASVHSETG